MRATDAETQTNSTPILDRLVPLPPPEPPGSGGGIAIVVGLGLFITASIIWRFWGPISLWPWALTKFAHWFPGAWTGARFISVCLALFAVTFVVVVIHEVGHALVGVCVGYRFNSLRVGPLLFEHPFRISFYRGSGAASGGWASMVPGKRDKPLLRTLALVIGGPAANLLSAVVALLLPFEQGFSVTVFILVSIGACVGELLPFRTRISASDGSRIWMLLRDRRRSERWLAILKLGAQIKDGALPESLPADCLAKAIAIRDNSVDTVVSHAIAYSAAFHQRRDAQSGQLLETSLQYSSYAAPAVREAMMCDAAVF